MAIVTCNQCKRENVVADGKRKPCRGCGNSLNSKDGRPAGEVPLIHKGKQKDDPKKLAALKAAEEAASKVVMAETLKVTADAETLAAAAAADAAQKAAGEIAKSDIPKDQKAAKFAEAKAAKQAQREAAKKAADAAKALKAAQVEAAARTAEYEALNK